MGRTNFKYKGRNKGKQYEPVRKPVKWNKDTCRMTEEMALLGLQENQMAKIMDISIHSIQYWRNNKKGFKEALLRGRTGASIEAVKSLFHRSIGYSHPAIHFATKKVKEFDKKGRVTKEYNEVIQIPYTKHYPPDTGALKYFLSTKERAIWAEKTALEMTHNHLHTITKKIDMKDMTEEELQLMKQIGMKSLVEEIPYEDVTNN